MKSSTSQTEIENITTAYKSLKNYQALNRQVSPLPHRLSEGVFHQLTSPGE